MQNASFASLLDTMRAGPRPLDYGMWAAPARVTLEGDDLVWPAEDYRWVRRGNGLLEKFINLVPPPSASDEANWRSKVLRFSQQWGTLGICENHGLPACHNPPNAWNYHHGGCWPKLWKRRPPLRSEPISAWKDLILKFRNILRVASLLYGGSVPTTADLRSCSPETIGLSDLDPPDAWHFVFGLVRWIVGRADLNVVPFPPRKNAGAARIKLMGSGLYAALATELMFAVCRTDGLAICSACGSPFIPVRRPRAKQRAYCELCRKRSKAPVRDAMRAYRKRIQDAVGLSGTGLSVAEIAEQLSLPNERVKAYLSHAR
jgi:hypothetical protein